MRTLFPYEEKARSLSFVETSSFSFKARPINDKSRGLLAESPQLSRKSPQLFSNSRPLVFPTCQPVYRALALLQQ